MAEARKPRLIEFAELRGDPDRRDGLLVAAGRCHVGPIRVGDRFTVLVDRRGVEHDVDLGVLDIGMYGGFVYEIDPVVSGELFMTGDVDIEIVAGATLRGSMPADADALCPDS